MGIYDRDYNRGGSYDDSPGIRVSGPTTVTVKLVIVTFAVYAVQYIAGGWFTNALELHDNWYARPWLIYELLTYGFLHSLTDFRHILFNMFVLWLFGREVEAKYGGREFLVFYLAAIVAAGVAWTLAELANDRLAAVVGASGGISAVLILYALCFPRRIVLFMFVIPMPMWVFGVLIVGFDIIRAMDVDNPVAATAHLGGALFGFLYYQRGMRLERWLPSWRWRPRLGRGSKLRVHDPDLDDGKKAEDDRVDEVLRKIREHGQDSLTWRERRILEKASQEYQKKRR